MSVDHGLSSLLAFGFRILLFSAFSGLSAFAPNVVFLLICRVFLGLGVGGEWASGEVLVAEKWPKEHRGKVIGMVQSGWGIGYILAAILATLIIPHFKEGVSYTIPILGITLPDIFEPLAKTVPLADALPKSKIIPREGGSF